VIVKGITTDKRNLSEIDKSITERLYYLDFSRRYQENPRYKKVSFDNYIEDQFSIRPGTYREKVRAYIHFDEDAVELGVGIITKIKKKCGVVKIPTVLNQIKAKDKKLKRPISRVQIEEIIRENSKPEKEKPMQIDWHSRYEAEHKELNQERRENKAKDEQIIRLKQGNKQLRNENIKLKARVKELERLREFERVVKPFFISAKKELLVA